MSQTKCCSYSHIQEKYKKQHIPYYEMLSTLEWQSIRKTILARDKQRCTKCNMSHFLQVHHIYYVRGWLPWSYPEDSLVTLCQNCHGNLHMETTVPVFEEIISGIFVKINSTPCKRCKGRGKFSQYKHIENGICFRCYGVRYEELIQNCVQTE